MIYNDPANGQQSSIGSQIRTDAYAKAALIEAVKEQYFVQTADVTAMPKHHGKKIKKYHYLALLDDRNINDQGIDATGAVIADGNLYGSSKDIGKISERMPVISENGGFVNRVGFTRKEIEGTIAKYGFYETYTQESLDFDTDEQLEMHINREMVRGANEMNEDLIQMDLLNGAGVVWYGGDAIEDAGVSGEEGAATLIDYDDLSRLDILLDENRTPKTTTIVTGSRLVDTKTLPTGRIMYIGTELQPVFEKMVDHFGNPAFIGSHHYAASGNVARGEIGMVGRFRIVVVPEMMNWSGKGAAVANNGGYRESNGKYNIYPALVVGQGAYTTIGFQTDGKTVKFKIKHAKPGSPESYAQDVYGESGFMSIKWYYGSMILRSERLAVIKTVAEI